MNPKLCQKCKGVKNLCGSKYCPIKSKLESLNSIKPKKSFKSSTKNVFIGESNYPNINVGVLSVPKSSKIKLGHDPIDWKENKINDVINYKINTVNSHSKKQARVLTSSNTLEVQEIAMSQKELDLDVELKKRPKKSFLINSTIFPHGLSEKVNEIDVNDNPSIPRKVENIFYDTDVKSYNAINELYDYDYDEYYLSKILSAGTLGRKTDRKFVPTKWSITAVDDTLGKNLIEKVKNYEIIDEPIVLYGDLKGNYIYTILLPNQFSFEFFEIHLPNSVWNRSDGVIVASDYESFFGRKKYADNTTGGYYAARYPVLDYLNENEIQASALVLRVVNEEYWAPLGVWVVREAVKNALSNNKINFESLTLVKNFLKKYLLNKFNYNSSKVLNDSVLLNISEKQSKLSNF